MTYFSMSGYADIDTEKALLLFYAVIFLLIANEVDHHVHYHSLLCDLCVVPQYSTKNATLAMLQSIWWLNIYHMYHQQPIGEYYALEMVSSGSFCTTSLSLPTTL